MEKLHFKIEISASKEKVWNTMLKDKTYRIWTEAFGPGSYYKGDWNKGSKILFLAPGEKGEMGMVSRIKENRKYEFISIEHLGSVLMEMKTLQVMKQKAGQALMKIILSRRKMVKQSY